jgi:hypothetical protein
MASKKDGQRLFGPNPGGEPMVKPQYPYLGPNSVWPFESKLPVKSMARRSASSRVRRSASCSTRPTDG